MILASKIACDEPSSGLSMVPAALGYILPVALGQIQYSLAMGVEAFARVADSNVDRANNIEQIAPDELPSNCVFCMMVFMLMRI